MKRLDYVVREDFIPAILNRSFSCTDELSPEILTLPPRFGGLGFPIMENVADTEYTYSRAATNELKEAIVQQLNEYTEDVDKLHEVKMEITKDRNRRYEDTKRGLLTKLPDQGRLMLELASEKGASSWLTALPIKEFGYLLNKQQFNDALCLRYNLTLKDCPKVCACGADNSVNHALICKLGGYVSMRHNWLRDSIAKLMTTAKCKDVQVELSLLPVNNCQLPQGTILGDQARLD